MTSASRLHAPVVLPCDPDCSVLRDAVVDVGADGRLGYVGPAAKAPPTAAPTRALPGILLPGLVNTHAHSPMTLLRGMGGDLPLLRWLHEVIWPAEARLRPADVYAGMLLGCVEMLRAGVTTSVEMYFHGDQVADAVLAAGSRVVVGGPLIDLPGMDWRATLSEIDKWIDADGLRFGPGERIELSYGAHSAYMLPAEALPRIAESAASRGALLQIHVAESRDEDVEQRARYGSVPRMLAELGVLGGRGAGRARRAPVRRGHRAVRGGTGRGGALPWVEREAGVRDRPTGRPARGRGRGGAGHRRAGSNDDLDLWEDVRLAAMLARLATGDANRGHRAGRVVAGHPLWRRGVGAGRHRRAGAGTVGGSGAHRPGRLGVRRRDRRAGSTVVGEPGVGGRLAAGTGRVGRGR